jgi:hypothetical protein
MKFRAAAWPSDPLIDVFPKNFGARQYAVHEEFGSTGADRSIAIVSSNGICKRWPPVSSCDFGFQILRLL